MTAKHTPGPWHCIGNAIGTESCEIATVWNPTDSPNLYYQKRANARLIAAAPDLLEALLAIMRQTNSTEHAQAFDLAVHAIAKATGGAA